MRVLLSIIQDNPLLVTVLLAITFLSLAVIILAWAIVSYIKGRRK